MKSIIPNLLLLGSLAAPLALSSPAANAATADGNWLWIQAGRNGVPDKENILHLKSDGSKLEGKISAPGAEGKPVDTPIRDGKIEGDTLSFIVVREANGGSFTNRYSGKVSAERIVGKIESGRGAQGRSRDWEAKNNGDRSVAASVPPPKPGYNEQGYKIVNETKYKDLPVDEAEKYIKAHPDAIILDLRPPASFAAGHLPNARNLDVTDDDHYKEFLKPLDKTKHYVVHSVTGHYRTVRTLEYFQENGFEHAVAIEGGYQAWAAAGKPTVK